MTCSNRSIAIISMLFGVTSMSFMAIGAKCIKAYTNINILKVALVRSTIMTFGSYCHGRFIGKIKPFNIDRKTANLLFFRGLFGTLAFYFELIAIYLMPISLAIVLYFTNPIMASLLSYIFIGEKLGIFDFIGIGVSMLGVVIVSKPDLIIPSAKDVRMQDHIDYPYYYWGVAAALSGSFSSGLAYLWMRRIG